MYALNLICFLCLLLSGDVTLQMTMEPSVEDNVTPPTTTTTIDTTSSSTITVTTAAPFTAEQRNCSTARALAGACVQRQFCEFSTVAIDLTLFMPRGFKHPCYLGETCCPFQYLLTVTKPEKEFDDSKFGFDDDD